MKMMTVAREGKEGEAGKSDVGGGGWLVFRRRNDSVSPLEFQC